MLGHSLEFLFRWSELVLILTIRSEHVGSVSFVAGFDELQDVRSNPMILFFFLLDLFWGRQVDRCQCFERQRNKQKQTK